MMKKLTAMSRRKTSDADIIADLTIEVIRLRAAIQLHKRECAAAGGGFVRDERLWTALNAISD